MNLAFRLARREMRSGLGGFRLFIACLALGVGAIAAILSFSRAIEEGLRADAREILGGDVAVSLLYREASPEQTDFLRQKGELVRWIDSRAMARPVKSDGHAALVQLKAVEPGYPLYGKLELKGGGSLSDAFAKRDGVWGAVVEEAALRRMNMALGERVKVGEATVELRGVIQREPDRGLNAFASLGPRLLIPFAALAESGIVQPGSLLTWEYRLHLPPGVSDRDMVEAIKDRYPDAGWRVRGLAEAGGGLRFWLDRLTEFIGLIGLAALLVGGVGVGNAISSFLATRLHTIATLKCLGAPERLVFTTYFLQLSALALVGVGLGVAVGAAVPFLAQSLIADLLPVRARVALYAQPLATAAAFGLLVSLLFALLPLIRARAVPAATLMRGAVVDRRRLGLARPRDDRRGGTPAGGLHRVHRRQPAHRSLFRAGRDRRLHCLPVAGPWRHGGGRPCGQAQVRGAEACAGQPPSSRRADAHRHAVAGAGTHRAGGDGADRRAICASRSRGASPRTRRPSSSSTSSRARSRPSSRPSPRCRAPVRSTRCPRCAAASPGSAASRSAK